MNKIDLNEDVQVPALALHLMSASVQQTTDIKNRLLESLQVQLDEAHAELELIRDDIRDICSGPYTPHPGTIVRMLYPSLEKVQEAAEAIRWERKEREGVPE